MARALVSLRTPQDVALAPPLMLGFWPADSVCAIFVDDSANALLVLRWDYDADVCLPASPLTGPGGPEPSACHLVVFPPQGVVDPPPVMVGGAAAALECSGVPLVRLLVVRRQGEDVWWVPGPPDGLGEPRSTGRPAMIPRSVVVGIAREWGLPAFSDTRREHVSDIEPHPRQVARVGRLLEQTPMLAESHRDDAIREARGHLLAQHLEHRAVAEVLAALRDVRVRDTILWDVMHLDPRWWSVVAQRLVDVVVASPQDHLAPPATLLAIMRWQLGDGARASAAAHAALASDPSYSLAQLVEQCLACGMHPATWRNGLRDLTRDECRRSA